MGVEVTPVADIQVVAGLASMEAVAGMAVLLAATVDMAVATEDTAADIR